MVNEIQHEIIACCLFPAVVQSEMWSFLRQVVVVYEVFAVMSQR